MFYLRGLEHNLQNVLLFCQHHRPVEGPCTRHRLKAIYNQRLALSQEACTLTSRPEPELVVDGDEVMRLASAYRNQGDRVPLDDVAIRRALPRQSPAVRSAQRSATQEALALLRTGNPPLGGLFDLVINRIFFFDLPEAHGGSHPGALGVIWASPPLTWAAVDGAEMLLHELTHQLLFLEEAVRGLFLDRFSVGSPDNHARSAFLDVPRRPDQALHSLVVGAELLLARERWLGHRRRRSMAHQPSPRLLDDCRRCADSLHGLAARGPLLTANGAALLSAVDGALDEIGAKCSWPAPTAL
jgi:hypothetical protein